MRNQTLFERILPARVVGGALLYNLSVVGLSLLAALVSFGLFTLVALLASYYASQKLEAGMAGMAIILLFMLLAGLLALAVFVVLLATNLRLPH